MSSAKKHDKSTIKCTIYVIWGAMFLLNIYNSFLWGVLQLFECQLQHDYFGDKTVKLHHFLNSNQIECQSFGRWEDYQ